MSSSAAHSGSVEGAAEVPQQSHTAPVELAPPSSQVESRSSSHPYPDQSHASVDADLFVPKAPQISSSGQDHLEDNDEPMLDRSTGSQQAQSLQQGQPSIELANPSDLKAEPMLEESSSVLDPNQPSSSSGNAFSSTSVELGDEPMPEHPINSSAHPVAEEPLTREAQEAMDADASTEAAILNGRIHTPYESHAPTANVAARGLPILSGPPPIVESDSCRTCGKSFIPLLRKPHVCNHCGYQYCSDHCSDLQALMPRRESQSPSSQGMMASIGQELMDAFSGNERPVVGSGAGGRGGYEMVEVCDNCYPLLQVTSGPPAYLRSLPIKRLQQYTKAYGLNTRDCIEKEDFVQTILKAKLPTSGCLPPEAETYYRKRSVPKQGVLPSAPPSRPASSTGTTRPTSSRPQPQTTAYRPASQPPPNAQRRTNNQSQYPYQPRQPQASQSATRNPHVAAPRPQPPRPTPAASAPRPRPPSPPVPTINSLVALPASYINTLSIGTLKAILYENHVKVDFSQILEKAELVRRVQELCKAERARLERQAKAEEEEAAALAAGNTPPEPEPTPEQATDDAGREPSPEGRPSLDASRMPVPTGPKAAPERDGLCVVCQDNEATLAVVDCGHLCMCADCSKLVMATTRECPLCRTRIVTEQRLIRIFRS